MQWQHTPRAYEVCRALMAVPVVLDSVTGCATGTCKVGCEPASGASLPTPALVDCSAGLLGSIADGSFAGLLVDTMGKAAAFPRPNSFISDIAARQKRAGPQLNIVAPLIS